MKSYYDDENNVLLCIFILVIIFITLLFGIDFYHKLELYSSGSLNIEYFFNLLSYIFIIIFLLICFIFFRRDVNYFKKWHKFLKVNGVKCSGKVVDIIEEKHYRPNYGIDYSYQYVVYYFSNIKNEFVTFKTSCLSFVPKKTDNITCDVYEMEKPDYIKNKKMMWLGDCVADNFKGFKKTPLIIWRKLILVFWFLIFYGFVLYLAITNY